MLFKERPFLAEVIEKDGKTFIDTYFTPEILGEAEDLASKAVDILSMLVRFRVQIAMHKQQFGDLSEQDEHLFSELEYFYAQVIEEYHKGQRHKGQRAAQGKS